MGRWCPWRNGRRNCWGPIADFIIQTQNLLHHFIGHRESNYSVVQFSTQWLCWGSKSGFFMMKKEMFCYFVCYLKIIILKPCISTRRLCFPFFFLEMELIIFIFLLLNNQAILLVVCWSFLLFYFFLFLFID